MKNRNKELKMSIFFVVIAFIIYIVLDYINLLHVIGLEFSNINMDLFAVIFNSFIVILLYLITYFMIDKKNVEKEYNARRTAHILMSLSYEKCKEIICLFDDNEMIRKYIVPKVDFNKTDSDNPVTKNLHDKPFVELEYILQLAGNGYIVDKRLEKYLSFISDYKLYISNKITFFDIDDANTAEQLALKKHIEDLRKSLKKTIDEELNLLSDNKEAV